MTKLLTNKQVLLIVSGSIAAYKSPDIVRRLQDLGAKVKVCLTLGGLNFITQTTLEAISGQTVLMPNEDFAAGDMNHIVWAKWADCVLVAPASANMIAKIANGGGDSLASSLLLAVDEGTPILLAPAMNQAMLDKTLVQQNLSTLEHHGIKIIHSEVGEQACGDFGAGRLADSEVIAQATASCFVQTNLSGKRVVITAGSTQEAIDPVRFISNHSSGKMATALANACVEQGAEVVFIYGAIQTQLPARCIHKHTLDAQTMFEAVMNEVSACDIFIAAAAVADYRVKNPAKQKIKRDNKSLNLTLIPNPDILKTVCALPEPPFSVGFAAQTENIVQNAQEKHQNKGCDMLIANDVSRADIGFGSDDNEVLVFYQNTQQKIEKKSKAKIAKYLVALIQKYYIK